MVHQCMLFLDASKAFDRVLHMKLFEKLIQRKLPMCFVQLLKDWYKEQTMQIKCGKHLSKPFHVINRHRRTGRHFTGGAECPENSNLP